MIFQTALTAAFMPILVTSFPKWNSRNVSHVFRDRTTMLTLSMCPPISFINHWKKARWRHLNRFSCVKSMQFHRRPRLIQLALTRSLICVVFLNSLRFTMYGIWSVAILDLIGSTISITLIRRIAAIACYASTQTTTCSLMKSFISIYAKRMAQTCVRKCSFSLTIVIILERMSPSNWSIGTTLVNHSSLGVSSLHMMLKILARFGRLWGDHAQ
mmetsp:Transcript_20081/g.29460  ORF Transcript_20081/g.29460 Transcript_20081/m.29460 type:complete len:214 (-) Transcript_20081:1681-2322(-)